jgi:transglutaminase-like putative cysteine protease
MKILSSILLLLVFVTTYGKDEPRYPVSAIPDELKNGAHAVVREDHMSFTILTKSTATLKVRFVVTIFSDKGKRFATQPVFYDKLRKINSFKAQAYDANGILIKRLKPNEITDHSAFEGLYDDSRVKVADLIQGRYPYTVEFEYEVSYRYLYHIQGSAINPHENVGVQNASYQLAFPESLAPRYKTHNVKDEPQKEKNNDIVTLTWTFANLKPQKFEPYSDPNEYVIRVEAAPTTFEFEGYSGKMDTWDEFGRWIASLNKGRNILPETTKANIQQMTKSLPSTEDKVRALYEYLQNKTRYVSIQLGIGGYQPFEASVVDKTGYGDCKALSNYMLTMLETIGIKGHYALIQAGDDHEELEVDFPSSQFNHVIVAVPNGKDTLWLECTSQTNPFGYQGRFTGDRKALLIADNGATIVNTQRYPAEVNLQTTRAEVTVASTGQATASFKRVYSGLQYENGGLSHYINGDHDQQKRWVQNHIGIPSFNLKSFTIANVKERIPSAVLTAEVVMDRFATVSGKRMFITPNLMNRSISIPEKVENRKTAIVKDLPFIDIDTVRYRLPEDIYPEFIPENVTISSPFGEYNAHFYLDQGSLVYVRKLRMNKGTFPASSYPDMIEFHRGINKADNMKIVFMTKT